MPTYICRAPEALFSDAVKAEIAASLTAIHHRVTGGGRRFTQVIFRPEEQGNCFIAGRLLEGPHCFVQGHVRAGRSAIERSALIREIVPALADILGVPRYAIWVYISEQPARAMAEFGHILPEQGDDDAWMEALPDEDRDRLLAL